MPATDRFANCSDHDEFKSQQIEMIKASILKKLDMQQPPAFSGRLPPRIPTDLRPKLNAQVQGYLSGTDMHRDNMAINGDGCHVKTHHIITFAQPHLMMQKRRKLQNRNLLYFTISEQKGQNPITKAILWLYKRRWDVVNDDSVAIIDVFRINPNNMHQLFVSSIKRAMNTVELSWVPIQLQRRISSDWLKTTDGAKNLTLMVDVYYLNKNTTLFRTPFVTDATERQNMTVIPYLEWQIREDQQFRARRSTFGKYWLNCNETSAVTQCGRYPLIVDFEELGWDWIIAPKKFEANYCMGECSSELSKYNNHTQLSQLTNKSVAHADPCCTPDKLYDKLVLYHDEDFNIIVKSLPNMVVNSCNCN
ncbi:LOW QUALITY PROTEIN: growth/differentiation factor 8-like [Rhopalosiphum padi]|uniref:LOW QUALITY PROTEIN: growth/differentiation factor 8-like n=1 Tax=Rhopalosiphum padi TaxID=40932 RepID=UPI00298EB489|nr:LOW QUALITY PROTEIN: growth/differentiation factor 8-like [Rhopalosiphum padi]